MADRHRHAQRLQAVEGLALRHAITRRSIIRSTVKGARDVSHLRRRRGFFQRSQMVFAGKLFVVLAIDIEGAVTTILAAVGSLVSS